MNGAAQWWNNAAGYLMSMGLPVAMFLAPAAMAVYLTSIFCRRSISHGRQPSFIPAIIAAVGSPIIVILASERSDLFKWQYWRGDTTGEPAPYLLFYVGVCATFALLPALGVVLFYREKI